MNEVFDTALFHKVSDMIINGKGNGVTQDDIIECYSKVEKLPVEKQLKISFFITCLTYYIQMKKLEKDNGDYYE